MPTNMETVHGKVDATKAQQQEELNEILRRARTNPWHLFKSIWSSASGRRCRDADGDTIWGSACSDHSVPQSPIQPEEDAWG